MGKLCQELVLPITFTFACVLIFGMSWFCQLSLYFTDFCCDSASHLLAKYCPATLPNIPFEPSPGGEGTVHGTAVLLHRGATYGQICQGKDPAEVTILVNTNIFNQGCQQCKYFFIFV